MFGTSVTIADYPSHVFGVAGPGSKIARGKTCGFRSVGKHPITEHNVAFGEAAHALGGQNLPYKQFIARLADTNFPKTGMNPEEERRMRMAASGRRLARMRDDLSRRGKGGFGGRIPGGFVEETPAWYDRGGRY